MLVTEVPFTGRILYSSVLSSKWTCVSVCVSFPLHLDLLGAFKTHQRRKLGHTETIMQPNARLGKTMRNTVVCAVSLERLFL